MDNFWVAAFWSIIPTVVVLGLFIYILRSVVHLDRNERRAYAKVEAQERAKRGLPPAPARTHPLDGRAPRKLSREG
ncbi:hypothetical protein [Microbacterium luticocti]|uniref:hypothetical protein n=1 Tax=Microbacterium luticocti TaxID=451764 RepID=UPI0003F55B13|nr:hypothetical protein [Microbacterium luticocti]